MYGISSMRSYVVKRLAHFRHSRRRRMESASLLSRESTTLSFANPQKGHFMGLGNSSHCNRQKKSHGGGRAFQVTLLLEHADVWRQVQVEAGGGEEGTLTCSCWRLSSASFVKESRSR